MKRKTITPQQKIDALEATNHGLSLWAWHRRLCKWMPGKLPKRLQNGRRQRRQDGYRKPPDPSTETAALPGKPGKIRIMSKRYAAGKHLYHPGDLLELPIGLAQKGNTTDTGNGRCTGAVKQREGYVVLLGQILNNFRANHPKPALLTDSDLKQIAERIPYEPDPDL